MNVMQKQEIQNLAESFDVKEKVFSEQTIETLNTLATKLQPMVGGTRFDNLVDLLALTSDMIDMIDLAMLEKLSGNFESATSLIWTISNVLRVAKLETMTEKKPPGLSSLLKLLREPETRRGLGFALRTLHAVGKQMKNEPTHLAT